MLILLLILLLLLGVTSCWEVECCVNSGDGWDLGLGGGDDNLVGEWFGVCDFWLGGDLAILKI